MSFNEQELIQIRDATSGIFKRSARKKISESLLALRVKIDAALSLPEDELAEEILRLLNKATAERQRWLRSGARSYGHPGWAAAAACETWLHVLRSGDSEAAARIQPLIDELSSR